MASVNPAKLGFTVEPDANGKKQPSKVNFIRRTTDRYYQKNLYTLSICGETTELTDALDFEWGTVGVSMNAEGEFLLCDQGVIRKPSGSGRSKTISVNCFSKAIEARYGTEFGHVYLTASTICDGLGIVLTPNGDVD